MSLQGLIVHFFVMLNNIPVSGWTIVYPSPAEGHRGYFQISAIMNEATINLHVIIRGFFFNTKLVWMLVFSLE